MLDKLNAVEARYEELNQQLQDPNVVQNQKRFRELTKESAELQKIVPLYRDYKQLGEQIRGNRDIIYANEDAELVALAQAELVELTERQAKLEERLKIALLPKDPNDSKNVILEIRSGTGGDEAALFAGELFRMYARYAERRGWRAEVLSSSPGTKGGFKEIIALLEGDAVYSTLKYESGVHRVQRVPETEAQGRIHTSACTVAVLPEADEVEVDILDKDLRIDVYRAGGPGGQSVNTTDSAVRITHIPTGVVVACQDEKSQHKNKAKALRILRSRILDLKQAEQEEKLAAERRSMIKSGDRSEKIRTYNFPQDRVTDHRVGLTLHNLPAILQGGLDDLVTSIRTYFQAEALKEGQAH